jgi:Cu-processing system ATP-binding protein
MIEVRALEKRFGRLHVLRGLDLDIAPGRVTAVLGPNGAGKTTLIKSLLGLVTPDRGTIRFDGEDIAAGVAYRRRVGYMPQSPRYPENLTVREILAMLDDLRGVAAPIDDELVSMFDLEPQLDKPFRTLSGGNRQRVSAAVAFRFCPDLLFLDEPTAGLDPVASSTLKDKIARERARGRTFILTSHVMSEVEELADTVIYLLDGRVWFEASIAELLARTGEPNLERAVARMMIRAVA